MTKQRFTSTLLSNNNDDDITSEGNNNNIVYVFHDDDAQIICNNLPPSMIDTQTTTFKIDETMTINASTRTTRTKITKHNIKKFHE